MPRPYVITEPLLEPITLVEAKAHCRIDVADPEQDSLINGYISAARDAVEFWTFRTAHQKTLGLVLDDIPTGIVELPGATPLISLDSITYRDKDGVSNVWSAGSYVTSPGAENRLGRVAPAFGQPWPYFIPYPLDPITIVYKAGIAPASPLVEPNPNFRLAVLLLVGAMFEHREAEMIPDRSVMQTLTFKYGLDPIIERLKVKREF